VEGKKSGARKGGDSSHYGNIGGGGRR